MDVVTLAAAKADGKKNFRRLSYSPTLATLGDSITCNGSNPPMAVTTLAASAAIGSLTLSINAPSIPAAAVPMLTDFDSSLHWMMKVGSEYLVLASTAHSGTGPSTLTLAAVTTQAHAAGEPVVLVPTYYNQLVPAAALVACLLSDGQLRYGGLYGHGSATVAELITTYLPLILNNPNKPGYCYVMAGRNGQDTAPLQVARITSIWDQLLTAGIMPVASTMPPASGQSAANRNRDQQINAGILREAHKRGIPVTDFYAAMVDPATGDYRSGYSSDSTHPIALQRLTQGQGILTAIAPFLPAAAPGLPSTNAYNDTTIHPLPASNTNALMLTGGGTSTGSGSTSVVPLNWQTSMTDAIGRVDTVAAPNGNGNALKLTRAAGTTSGTNSALANNSSKAALVAGHRYRATCRFKTNGFTAAKAADTNFTGLGVKLTQTNFAVHVNWFGIDQIAYDLTSGVCTLNTEFIQAHNNPDTSIYWMLTIDGTAATPQVDATLWGFDIIDLTAMGEDGTSVWPF